MLTDRQPLFALRLSIASVADPLLLSSPPQSNWALTYWLDNIDISTTTLYTEQQAPR